MKNQGFSFFFHRLQSYVWLRAPVNLCPIKLKISVHVATKCGNGWYEFQVPSSRIVGLGSSDVREKSLPGWKFRVEDFSMSVSSQLAPLICVRFRSKLLCMYSDSGASADMNLKSLTQLLRDCVGEESGIFVFFHRLQSYIWLRAPVDLCPIGLTISVHVGT